MIERLDIPKLDLVKTVEVLRKDGVSFDIDGVEVASAILSLQEYNQLYGLRQKTPKMLDDVKDYGIMVDWIDEGQEEDPWDAAVSIWNSPQVLENAGCVEGVKVVLKFLESRGIVPYRITSRPGYTRRSTYRWYLKEYGLSFDLELIRIQDEQNTEINPDFKVDEINKLGTGFHFEDSFENAEKVIAATDATVILVPQPWNQDCQPTDNRIIEVNRYGHRMKMVRAFLSLAERITYG